ISVTCHCASWVAGSGGEPRFPFGATVPPNQAEGLAGPEREWAAEGRSVGSLMSWSAHKTPAPAVWEPATDGSSRTEEHRLRGEAMRSRRAALVLLIAILGGACAGGGGQGGSAATHPSGPIAQFAVALQAGGAT